MSCVKASLEASTAIYGYVPQNNVNCDNSKMMIMFVVKTLHWSKHFHVFI